VAVYRCFWGLGESPFVRWDEETNVRVVEESLNTHSFPVLLLDEKPFFEKPPLWYGLTMGIQYLFGIHALSMRLVSAFCGVGIIVLTMWIGYSWYGTLAGYISGIVLLCTEHLFIQNPGGIFSSHTYRSADTDTLQQFLILGSVWMFWKAIRHPFYGYGAACLAGLSILTKGPLGFIPFLFGSLWMIKTHKQSIRYIVGLIGVFFVTILPWYAYMTMVFGNTFIQSHFGYHLFYRTTLAIEGHSEPWWFYISILTNRSVFPVHELLFLAVLYSIFKYLQRQEYRYAAPLFFLLIPFLSISIVQTKLAWYLLPIYPYASLLIGSMISEGIQCVCHRKTGFRRFFV
jgi:4-amino-4-deoxy-L-arabinose transferase-like glycosyltransferase